MNTEQSSDAGLKSIIKTYKYIYLLEKLSCTEWQKWGKQSHSTLSVLIGPWGF